MSFFCDIGELSPLFLADPSKKCRDPLSKEPGLDVLPPSWVVSFAPTEPLRAATVGPIYGPVGLMFDRIDIYIFI